MALYEVYTFGGGDALDATFHMVNSVLGTDTYTTAIKISLGFGFIWVLLNTAFKGKFGGVSQWLIAYMVIFNVLFVPKANIVIVDRIDKGLTTSAISDVPWGLAYFAHISSKVGDVITRTMELASSLPNDLNYHQNGALFGSTLVERAGQFKIVDPEFSESINSFVKQCVFYDLMNGIYTMEDLFNAPDVWKFLSEHRGSPYRAFSLNGQYITCREGVNQLSTLWSTQIDKAATVYGQRFFRRLDGPNAKAQLLATLPTSYQYIAGVSEDAGNLMRQNMMINAFEAAVSSAGAEVDANAAITNYVQTRADTQANSAYKATARQASKFVPLLRVVFECLYYGAFPLLLLAAMLPIGASILRNYFLAFVWIQSWGPLYAVLNILMTLEARGKSIAASSLLNDSHALTILTKTGIETINADIATLAGYLSISIPFIAAGIAKGASAFTHLAGSILSVAQGAASRAAEEGTTGNINFGNSTQGVHAYNNTSANQIRTSGSLDVGSMSQSMGDGSMLTYTPDGRAVLNARGAHSDLPGASIDLNQSRNQAFSREASNLENLSQDQSIQSREALASAYAKTLNFDQHRGLSQGSSEAFRTSEQTAHSQEAALLREHAESFSKISGLSITDSAQMLASASAGLSFKSMVGFGPKGGLEARFTGMTTAEQKEAYDKAQRYAESHNLRDSFSNVTQAVADGSYETSDRAGQELRDSIRSDLMKNQELAQSSSLHHSQADSLRQSLAESESSGASVHGSLNQRLFETLAQQKTPTGGIMGTEQARALLNSTDPNDRQLVHSVANQIVEAEISNIKSHAMPNANLQNTFEHDQKTFGTSHNPQNFYNQNVDATHQQALDTGIAVNNPVNDKHKNNAQNMMRQQQAEMDKQGWGPDTKGTVEDKQKEWKDNLPLKTVSRGLKNVAESVTLGGYDAKD